ncbi:MAG: Bax inhibitor-1/YccA family protein [Candidatus Omnitrophica bacterium]|nr:Bax inhibitor-1/YccA family protein [Candidatus Omnitrophota bacterium]
MIRSGNPALRGDIFTAVRASGAESVMTIQGTVNKTILLLGCVIVTAFWAWNNMSVSIPLIIPAAIIGFVVAIVTVFKKEWSSVTTVLYALMEGIVLGGISVLFEMQYQGIVFQAVTLTFATLFSLLIAYKSRLIKVTENFKLGVVAATGGIFVVYLVSYIMSFFGGRIPFIHESGPLGIGFSVFVVVIAALNLVMDFDFIERGAEYGAPKYMEWYGAFGLIVTLVWLYLEILRLLAKLRER